MTFQFWIKTLLSALVIAGASELAKRSSWLAAILISLPLSSLLALVWTYVDTGDTQRVADLSWSILWAIIPSAAFFVSVPLLLRSGLRFEMALPAACGITAASYAGWVWALARFGVRF